MKEPQIHNIPKLTETRRLLRHSSTFEEKLLWRYLKGQQTGYKFRRQHSIDRYVVDFYCADKRVSIELDGAQHNTPEGKEYDELRTQHLTTYNIRELRFSNAEIRDDVVGVVNKIISFIEVLISP
jgi:very-short-patch-repair endonuclease